MKKKDCVEIGIKDAYQMLIAELRYGYTRNNHLMPCGAYAHVKEYLPVMEEANPEWALKTAQQAAEECISDELSIRLTEEDESKNRKLSIEFVGYLVDWICKHENGHMYMPYNYDHFVEITGED